MGTMADKVDSRRRPNTRLPRKTTEWFFRPYWKRVRLRVGDRVCVTSSSRAPASKDEGGFLRYWGKIHCAAGYWAGIELDLPHGQNNGSLDGRQYFLCSSERGLFVRVGRCRTRDGYGVSNGRRTSLPGGRITRQRVDNDDDSNVEPPGKKTLGAANVPAAKVALNHNLPSNASGLSTGRRGSPPAVSVPDGALAGQPMIVAPTAVKSSSTSSSSGGEGLPDTSGLAPGNCLDSNDNKKNNLEHVEGYALARIPIDKEERKGESVAEDNADGVTSGSEQKKGDFNSSCAMEEQSSRRRRRTSIVEETKCLARSCDQQGEMYAPGGACMLGPINGAVLDTKVTARIEREGSPPGVGVSPLGWNPIGRAVKGGGEKANVKYSERIYGEDCTRAVSTVGRMAQRPLLHGPTRAGPTNIGGDTQGLLLHETDAASLPETSLSNENDASSHKLGVPHPRAETTSKTAPDRPESLKRSTSSAEAAEVGVGFVFPATDSVPSTSRPPPMSRPVKGSAFAAVPAREISGADEVSPESCEERAEVYRREPFCRTTCDSWPAVGTNSPCLAGSTASSVPEESINVRRRYAGVCGTAKFGNKTQHYTDDVIESGTRSMANMSSERGSVARKSAEQCRAIVPWARPSAAEDGTLNKRVYGVLPTPSRQSEGTSQPMLWLASRSTLASVQLEVNLEEFDENTFQVATHTPQRYRRSQEISAAARSPPGAKYPAEDPPLLPSIYPRIKQNIVAQREGGWMSTGPEDTIVVTGASTAHPVALRLNMARSLQLIAHRCDGSSVVRRLVVQLDDESSRAPVVPCTVGTVDRTTPTHAFPASQSAKGTVEGEGLVHPLTVSGADDGGNHAVASESTTIASVTCRHETVAVGPEPNQIRQLESSRHDSERAMGQTSRSPRCHQTSKELVDSGNCFEHAENDGRGETKAARGDDSDCQSQTLTSSVWDADVIHRSPRGTRSDMPHEPFDENPAKARQEKTDGGTLPTGHHRRPASETMVSIARAADGPSSPDTPSVSGNRIRALSVSQGQRSSTTVIPPASTNKEHGIPASRFVCMPPPPLLGSLQLVGAGEPAVLNKQEDVGLTQVTPATSVECSPTPLTTGRRADPPAPPAQPSLSPRLPPPPMLGQPEQHAAPAVRTRVSVGSSSSGSVNTSTDCDENDRRVRLPRSLTYHRRRRPRRETRQHLSTTVGQIHTEHASIGRECTQSTRSPITSPALSVASGHTSPVGLVPAVSPGRIANGLNFNRHTSRAGCQQQQHQHQQQQQQLQQAEPTAACTFQSENRSQTRALHSEGKCAEKKKRRFCRSRHPPPPAPPPSPSPATRRDANRLSGRVSPPRLRWEIPVGKRAVARKESVGTCDVSRELVASQDLANVTPSDGDDPSCSQQEDRPCFCSTTARKHREVASETEEFEVVFLPPSTPPPSYARRRAKAPLMPAAPSPAHAVANTPPHTPTRARSDACRRRDTSGEVTLAASAPSNQRSTRRACSSADVVDSGSERTCVAPPNRATAGPRACESSDDTHEGREGFPDLARGDLGRGGQHGVEIEPVVGGWSDSYDGFAAKRRAHGISVRVAALERSFDRVEEEALGTRRIGTSSGVNCVSAGVKRERNSESHGEGAVGMRDVTGSAARPVTGGGGETTSLSTEVAAGVGGSDSVDHVFRAALALGDQLLPSPPRALPLPEDFRDRQQTPEAANEPLAAAETESRNEQKIDLHRGAIFPMALAAAGQLAPGRRALEGRALVCDGSEQAVDSFYFNLGRSMVQDSFGSEQAVDTTAYRRSLGWDAGGLLSGIVGR